MNGQPDADRCECYIDFVWIKSLVRSVQLTFYALFLAFQSCENLAKVNVNFALLDSFLHALAFFLVVPKSLGPQALFLGIVFDVCCF